jgi:hypothetical protein
MANIIEKAMEGHKKKKERVSHSAEEMHEHWINSERKNKPYVHGGKKYRVGKMSYGDYFLEPHGKGAGEKSNFSSGTKWFSKNKGKYELE